MFITNDDVLRMAHRARLRLTASEAAEVERYRSGETRLLGYFIGKVMRRSAGRADPKALSTLIRDRLGS